MVSKKKPDHLCEGGVEKSVPWITFCHHSASLVMPNGDLQDGFFYPFLSLVTGLSEL